MNGTVHGPAGQRSHRRGAAVLLAVSLGFSLGACTVNPAPGPTTSSAAQATAAVSSPATGTASPTTVPGDSTSTTSPPAGCPAGGSVPAGAATGATAELDGDGRADILWLSGGEQRTLGVSTASGAVFSTVFSSAAPQAASALGARLGEGSAIVLLNTGRSVPLYAVIGCELVPTANVQGQQYTFDLGFTGYGTGVGCVDLGKGRELVGLNARSEEDGQSFQVTRTPILLHDHGASAINGTTEVIAKEAAPQDPVVTTAQSVTCGKDRAQVHEPPGLNRPFLVLGRS
jgi:hypothetical protein